MPATCRFILHYGDLTDSTNLIRIMQQISPTRSTTSPRRAMSAVSFESPEYTANADAHRRAAAARGDPHPRAGEADALLPGLDLGALRPGAGECRRRRPRRSIRARPTASPSSTPTGSRSITARPTACTPATASCSTTRARSAARPSSRARSRAASPRIEPGLEQALYLGNLDAKRDWGHARDYVEGSG